MNQSLIESIRSSILSSVDLNAEVKNRIEEVFQRFKREDRRGLIGAGFVEEELDGKEWRNSLKHLANLVAYSMKTSSLLVNLGGIMCKRALPSGERRTAAKTRSVKFSEEIFERHRKMIQLIRHFEETQPAGIRILILFAKRVSEAGKEELTCQENYMDSLVDIVGKE